MVRRAVLAGMGLVQEERGGEDGQGGQKDEASVHGDAFSRDRGRMMAPSPSPRQPVRDVLLRFRAGLGVHVLG